MAGVSEVVRAIASMLVLLNFSMCVVVLGISGWAMNKLIDDGTVPGGNAATPYLIIFSLIAGVMGAVSCSFGAENSRRGGYNMVPATGAVAIIATGFTVLAFGFACKHISLHTDNAKLKTLEAFIIILTATKKLFTIAILSVSEPEDPKLDA